MKISLSLPPFKIEGEWKGNNVQKIAAWDLYVELITRVAVIELPAGHGLCRETLTSLYNVFQTTREILRSRGPSVATNSGKDSQVSCGYIALAVLNTVLRPFLSKWHPRLADWEHTREPGRSVVEHEAKWPQNEEFRKDLESVRGYLINYADLLAEMAGVPIWASNRDAVKSK